MSPLALRRWSWVHRWTSLVCTAFLLMLCITGLPLIFHDEIDRLMEGDPTLPPVAAGTRERTLDEVVAAAVAAYPGERPLFMSFDDDRPVANVTTGPSVTAEREQMHLTAIDRRTGEIVGRIEEDGFMHVILRLHVDMFAGLPGKLFLGFMGVLFLVATVSGVVLYAPFTRRLRFGTVRVARSRRTTWLDWHNVLGIATLMWVFVVGLTGVINTLSEPLVALWRADRLAALTAPYAGQPVPGELASLDKAMAAALQAAPGMTPQFVAFPGVRFSSNHHYAIWMRGTTPATRQLFTPALVDARTGKLTAISPMPWYMLALRLSKPLHFGDYGGLPLKVLWAVLTVASIVILASGLYLWAVRRRYASASEDVPDEPDASVATPGHGLPEAPR